jgi:hypothetical protein
MKLTKGRLNGLAHIFALYKKEDVIISIGVRQKITINKDGSVSFRVIKK